MEAVAGGGVALLVLSGYALLKRFRRSTCHSTNSCCEIDSPADEIQRAQTERIDKQEEKLTQIMTILEQKMKQDDSETYESNSVRLEKNEINPNRPQHEKK